MLSCVLTLLHSSYYRKLVSILLQFPILYFVTREMTDSISIEEIFFKLKAAMPKLILLSVKMLWQAS